eukprot:SAG31_NODE_780_length_12148_cov_7.369295_2_plen_320_part_00
MIIDNYDKYEIPLSVGVLDVPWHNINYAVLDLGPDKKGTAPPGRGCNGWDGFTFNRTLFPNPKRFFDKVHSEGIKMILSVHMQNGIDHCQEQFPAMAQAMGYSPAEIAANWTINCTMDNVSYVENFFKYIVNADPVKGTADYWWLDYPGGASNISGWTQQEAASLQWSNRMFAEHKRSMGERPVILARYGGLGQQRDGLGFSGDTFQSYGTLEFQAVMTPAASNVLFGWCVLLRESSIHKTFHASPRLLLLMSGGRMTLVEITTVATLGTSRCRGRSQSYILATRILTTTLALRCCCDGSSLAHSPQFCGECSTESFPL